MLLLGQPARADDVDLTTDTTSGVNLDTFSGTTVRVFPGVTISNTGTLIPGGIGSSFCGIFASTSAWTLTNQGTVAAPLSNAVNFKGGGQIINQGMIDAGFNGVSLAAGGSVQNNAGAVIHGGTAAIVCPFTASFDPCPAETTVINAGTLTSDGADTVALQGGGTITNLAGALIQGHGESNAISILFGTTRLVTNSGTIQSNDEGFATGVSLNSGTLVNNAGGRILGAYNGVWANGAGATDIDNAGLIEASKAAALVGTPGSAIEVDAGGHDREFGHHPLGLYRRDRRRHSVFRRWQHYQ